MQCSAGGSHRMRQRMTDNGDHTSLGATSDRETERRSSDTERNLLTAESTFERFKTSTLLDRDRTSALLTSPYAVVNDEVMLWWSWHKILIVVRVWRTFWRSSALRKNENTS